MDKPKKNKGVIILLISVLVVLLTVIGVSIAYLRATRVQNTDENVVSTLNCLDVDIIDETNAINLTNAVSVTDTVGLQSTPYVFRVTNNCTGTISADITLESLQVANNALPKSYVRGSINEVNTTPQVFALSNSATEVDATITNATSNYLTTFTLGKHNSKEFELRLWLSESVTASQGMNKTYHGKIVIIETAIKALDAPNGWSTASSSTLMGAIRDSNSTVNSSETLTTPGVQVATSNEGLRSTPDDYGISYYYRGAIENNYVVFADMCWRIVRVDGNGNTKLVLYNYNSGGVTNPCDSEYDTTDAAFARYDDTTNGLAGKSVFNSSSNKNAYIGYTYGTRGSSTYDAEHDGTTLSTILTNLKTWYDAKFNRAQKAQLADVIWCNDKSLNTNSSFNPLGSSYTPTNLGYNTQITYYGATTRLFADNATSWTKATTSKVTLICPNASGNNAKLSKYTASDTTNGNGYLTINDSEYKIGLLTADEIAFAGIVLGSPSNTSYYLYRNANSEYWWSLSPYLWASSNASVWLAGTNGTLSALYVNSAYGLRPSVSLVSTANVTTTSVENPGTQSNPFIVD